MFKSMIAMMAVCALGFLPRAAHAQGKTFSGDHYSIVFATTWDTLQSHSVLGKNLGLSGLATLGAELGNSLPNVDSLTKAYSDSLGGDIKKDSSGQKTIGTYDVHWQKYTYDTLPKLSEAISKETGFPVTLRKGEFRVYYLSSGGVRFAIACISITGGKPPYADVEAALATLKLTTQTGIIPLAPGLARDLWVKDGKLGGGWLKANRVYAVECYDTRGAFLGQAAHAAEGTWQLPKAQGEMLVRLKTAGGSGLHFLVRQ
jgi:hypothetical protein